MLSRFPSSFPSGPISLIGMYSNHAGMEEDLFISYAQRLWESPPLPRKAGGPRADPSTSLQVPLRVVDG